MRHFGNGKSIVVHCFRSGGPLMDIVETSEGSQTGYLAVRATEYADCIANILYNTKEENETIRNAARLVSVSQLSQMILF